MATNRSNLTITSLDFDSIKDSLKTYLKAQDQFRDYDFEGSGLNILLDLLSANTHYMAFYANMVANESFLDSCKIPESAISIAKHLDYIPKSYRAAVTYVNVELLNVPEETKTAIRNGRSYYIVQGSQFTAKNPDGKTLTFTSTKDSKVIYDSGKYIASDIEIKEGTYKTATYVVDTNNDTQRFSIPEPNVDTTTLEVRVQRSLTDTTDSTRLWYLVTDLNKLTEDSYSYFLQYHDGTFEIYFGDGIVGKQPETGNVVTIKYLITSGPEGNEIGKNESGSSPTFTYLDDADSAVTISVDTDGTYIYTYGGSLLESLESIKYYAPRNYQAQERAVTAEDYRTLLARQYSEQADSVFVWGGEDNDPPIYGKVFVSIKPTNGKKFTQAEKSAIAKNILKERNLVSITPEIVDPDYLYVLVTSEVLYDPKKTSLSQTALENLVTQGIIDFSDTYLEKFDRNLRYSRFSSEIDNMEDSILSNITTFRLQKRFEPNLGVTSSYSIKFDNALFHPVDGYSSILESNAFYYYDPVTTENKICYLDDDGSGNVRIYKIVDQDKIYINETAGTINYTTGKVTLTSFKPVSIYDAAESEIRITVTPNKSDLYSRRNLILILDEDYIDVTATKESLRYDPYNASASSFPYNTGT